MAWAPCPWLCALSALAGFAGRDRVRCATLAAAPQSVTLLREEMPPRKKLGSYDFALRAAPFLFMLSLGSWGLSQFLKLPTQIKDDRAKRRKQGRDKFDLVKENENLKVSLQDKADHYENVRVPGPRPKGRVAAD